MPGDAGTAGPRPGVSAATGGGIGGAEFHRVPPVRDPSGRRIAPVALRSGYGLAEGSERWGKDRVQHYRIAPGSAAEAKAALGLARIWGFIDGSVARVPNDLLVRVQVMLWRLRQGRG